jgi:hypothetical protein
MNLTRLARANLALLAVLLVGVFWLSGCQGLPVGPSLKSVTVSPMPIGKSTTTGDPALCCCHASGTVTNANTVGVKATFQFKAIDLQGKDISTVLYFVDNLGVGQTKPIDAPGFLVPCNAISTIKTDIEVKGLTTPF